MGEIMLSVEFLKWGYGFIPIVAVTFLVGIFVKNSIAKMILLALKTVAYAGLAFLMWKYYQGKEQIDIVSCFTFIFCCFEATDNIVSLLSIPISEYRQSKERLQDKLEMLDMAKKL